MTLVHLNPYIHEVDLAGSTCNPDCPACRWANGQEGKKLTLEWRDGKLWETSNGAAPEEVRLWRKRA